MEDVVLHFRPGAAEGLGELLVRAEQLLEPFPRRPPPVFTPWFPDAAARPPIRPARAAPVITCWRGGEHAPTAVTPPLPENSAGLEAETHSDTPAGARSSGGTSEPLAGAGAARASTRCWSLCGRDGVSLQCTAPPTKHFQHAVSVHRLHLRQRVRWLISRHNCGATPDMEQVWRAVSHSVQSSLLPTCNAHIQREGGNIWVFCDLLHAEQVGRLLKERLQLSGSIRLWVHRHGHIYSM